MSVKLHEAFSLDSFQDRLLFFDDFHGDQIQDEWLVAGTGTGVVVDAQTGGICRLTSGATTGDTIELDWGNIASLLVTKKVTWEARVKITATTNVYVLIGLANNALADWLFFRYDTGIPDTNWTLWNNGVGNTAVDSGILPDTNYHIFRIEALPTGEVHYYIDGVECGNSPVTTNIPATYLQPAFYDRTREDVAKVMDIDYVYIRQER